MESCTNTQSQINSLYKDTVDLIKATIISKKGGISIKKINNEFRRFTECDIPYFDLNYSCLNDFLKSIPGLSMKRVGQNIMLDVIDSNSEHIKQLVQNQNNRKLTKQLNETIQKSRKRVNFKNNLSKPSFRKNRSSSTGSRNSSNNRSTNSNDDFANYGSKSSCQPFINITIDPDRQMKVICEPIAFHQQLIGDDFFLQLAIRELRANNLWRKSDKSAIHSGLCISGQTLKDCIKHLSKLDAISNRIVIMLGAVDIYKGHTLERVTEDFDKLLEICEKKFLLSKSAITLCTLPPLVNIPLFTNFERMSTLYGFNNYIRSIIKQNNKCANNYGFIDFFEEFNCTDEEYNQYSINFDLFQIEARMVSGCPNPHVLWNKKGRNLAMELLRCASIGQKPAYGGLYK